METAVDGTFGLCAEPSSLPNVAYKADGVPACADSDVQWDFVPDGMHEDGELIIDEMVDFQEELHSNSEFSSEGTVLFLDEDPFSSAETPEALSGEENCIPDSNQSESLLYSVPMPSTLLSKFALRVKQEDEEEACQDSFQRSADQPPLNIGSVHMGHSPAMNIGVKGTGNRSRSSLNSKSSLMCSYSNCPLPYQSNKWRTVTPETGAGGQDWSPLMGKLLCDSCYSTYRKHGTLVRSVRTSEGWSRIDVDGTCRPNNAHPAAKKRPRAEGSGEYAKAKRVAAEAARQAALAQTLTSTSESPAGRPCREKRPSIRLREMMEEHMTHTEPMV